MEQKTYSSSFFSITPGKATGPFVVVLIHGHVIIIPRLVRFSLRHLLGHCLLLIDDGCSNSDQRVLVSTLQVKDLFDFVQSGQGPQQRSSALRLMRECSISS